MTNAERMTKSEMTNAATCVRSSSRPHLFGDGNRPLRKPRAPAIRHSGFVIPPPARLPAGGAVCDFCGDVRTHRHTRPGREARHYAGGVGADSRNPGARAEL